MEGSSLLVGVVYLPGMAENECMTAGQLIQLLKSIEVPADAPVTAVVFDDSHAGLESEVAVRGVRLEALEDGSWGLLIDTVGR